MQPDFAPSPRQKSTLADAVDWTSLIDHLACGIAVFDAEDRLVFCNADFRELYGPIAKELVAGRSFEEILRSAVGSGLVLDAAGQEEAWIAQRLRSHRQPEGPMLRRLADGRWRRIVETRLSDGALLAFSVDVTEVMEKSVQLEAARHAAQVAVDRLDNAIEALPAGFELWDADDRLVLCNSELRRMYPHIASHLVAGAQWEDLLRLNHASGALSVPPAELDAYVERRRTERATGSVPAQHATVDGRWIHTLERTTPEGSLVCVRTDVTEQVRREQRLRELNAELAAARAELEQLSETDALTAIANRRRFDRRLAEEWARIGRHPAPLALLMIDVDHFKLYNDRYGHGAGDACLRRIAAALAGSACRANDLVARYGGEEFAVLLPVTGIGAAAVVAERCIARVDAAGIEHQDSPVASHVTISVGIAVAEAANAAGPSSLLQSADRGLYRAKTAGRHRVGFEQPAR